MKKYIWISLLLIISCGSRKSSVSKQYEKVEEKTEQTQTTETKQETKTETSIDYSKFWENQNIVIGSDGNLFNINYNGFVYSGSAPITITNQKEEIKYKFLQRIQEITITHTKFQTKTTYKSVKTSKDKETERKSYPWYWIVLGTILIWELLKLATKKYRGKFLEGL